MQLTEYRSYIILKGNSLHLFWLDVKILRAEGRHGGVLGRLRVNLRLDEELL